MLERVLPLFRPFGSQLVPSSMQVRNNTPWHRKNYVPAHYPFRIFKKLTRPTVERRSQTEGGRHILMRRVLAEKHFIAWNWPSKKPDKQRLSYPL